MPRKMFDQETLAKYGERQRRLAPVNALAYRDRVVLREPLTVGARTLAADTILIMDGRPALRDSLFLTTPYGDVMEVPVETLAAVKFDRQPPPANEQRKPRSSSYYVVCHRRGPLRPCSCF
jgi:hypothetical protein